MDLSRFRVLLLGNLCFWGSITLADMSQADLPKGDSSNSDFFERKIRPVLIEHCYECHAGESRSIQGGLRLDTADATRQGGDSGPAVVPGDVDASLLIAAIRYESFEMPPQGKLGTSIVADFVSWVESGAVDPRQAESPLNQPPGDSASTDGAIDWDQAASHWSFVPPREVSPPGVAQSGWVRRPIDAFVLARLEAEGLVPNEPADRRTLLRRLSLDLTGLPPSYQEVEQFVNDPLPGAYERVVERLLGSVHHGEHWARLWLDIARYAEDQAHIVGSNQELFYPNAHLYRDWVISALNRDLPYDQFCRLQLAADLIVPDDTAQHAALGFLGLGPKYYRRKSPEVMADEWEDRVDTVTRGLLGVTVACARCHDHKYDPIPTEDYYALAGVFASTEMFNRPLDESVEHKDDGNAKEPEGAMHIVRESEPRDLKVMIRGDVANEGEQVGRGFLSVLSAGEREAFTEGSGRLELANAIASPENPLTARVIVNRVWGQYFGQPLVRTASNFGMLGEPPTHSELLDDLAARFMRNGWSLKWLHREIVHSATYQQSSRIDRRKLEVDPSNRWLWRATRRRLTAETWRDGLLHAGGTLELTVGGPSIVPSDPQEARRTIYSTVSRFQLDPYLALADFPDPNSHSEGRTRTTTPIQKLFALNSEFIVYQAEQLARRITAPAGMSDRERISRAYQIVFARLPDDEELQLGLHYLTDAQDSDAQDSDGRGSESRWVEYAQALLVSNELLVVD